MAAKESIFSVLLLFLFASGTCGYVSSFPRCSDEMIGIDVGVTYSSVGVCRNEKFEVIPNELGNRITPSCVGFTDTEVLVGEAAKNQSDVNPERTICDVKRLLGRRFDDPEVQRDIRTLPYKIIDKDGKPHVEVKISGEIVLFSPEQVMAKLYKGVKEMAEAFLSKEIESAVVSVPAYFNDDQNRATWDACTAAGFRPYWTLPEPIAAVMAYGLDKEALETDNEKENVLVFNLGSSTFEISVLSIYDNGDTEIAATRFDPHLGGDDFDHELFDKITTLMSKVLGDAKLEKSDIHHVVVVGGGTRIPEVQKLLKDIFPGKELLMSLDPDEAVVRGATIQCWLLQGGSQAGQMLSLFAVGSDMSVGIETEGGIVTTVIPRGTIQPTWKSLVFTTYQDWQTAATVKIYEGERPLTEYCREIGRINLTDIAPARRGVAEIEVSFHMYEGDTMYVTAVDSLTGISKSITIQSLPEAYKDRVNPDKLFQEFTARRRLIPRLVREAKKFSEEDKKAVERIMGRTKLETYLNMRSLRLECQR